MKDKVKAADKRANQATRDAARAARAAEQAMKAVEQAQAKPPVAVPIYVQGFTPMTAELGNTVPAMDPMPSAAPTVIAPAEFYPTQQQRQYVYDMATWRVPHEDMARRIINENTGRPITTYALKKYFVDELAQGGASGRTEIAKMAFLGATGYPAVYDDNGNLIRAERPPNPGLVIWATKVGLGWTEKKNVDITHRSGDDPEVMETLRTLSPDELRTLRDFSRRRALEKPAEAQPGDRQAPLRTEP